MSTRSKLLCCLLTLQTFGKRSSKRGDKRETRTIWKNQWESSCFNSRILRSIVPVFSRISSSKLDLPRVRVIEAQTHRYRSVTIRWQWKIVAKNLHTYTHRPWSGDITSSRLSSTLRRGTLRSSSYIDRSDICASQKFIIERRIGKYSTSWSNKIKQRYGNNVTGNALRQIGETASLQVR